MDVPIPKYSATSVHCIVCNKTSEGGKLFKYTEEVLQLAILLNFPPGFYQSRHPICLECNENIRKLTVIVSDLKYILLKNAQLSQRTSSKKLPSKSSTSSTKENIPVTSSIILDCNSHEANYPKLKPCQVRLRKLHLPPGTTSVRLNENSPLNEDFEMDLFGYDLDNVHKYLQKTSGYAKITSPYMILPDDGGVTEPASEPEDCTWDVPLSTLKTIPDEMDEPLKCVQTHLQEHYKQIFKLGRLIEKCNIAFKNGRPIEYNRRIAIHQSWRLFDEKHVMLKSMTNERLSGDMKKLFLENLQRLYAKTKKKYVDALKTSMDNELRRQKGKSPVIDLSIEDSDTELRTKPLLSQEDEDADDGPLASYFRSFGDSDSTDKDMDEVERAVRSIQKQKAVQHVKPNVVNLPDETTEETDVPMDLPFISNVRSIRSPGALNDHIISVIDQPSASVELVEKVQNIQQPVQNMLFMPHQTNGNNRLKEILMPQSNTVFGAAIGEDGKFVGFVVPTMPLAANPPKGLPLQPPPPLTPHSYIIPRAQVNQIPQTVTYSHNNAMPVPQNIQQVPRASHMSMLSQALSSPTLAAPRIPNILRTPNIPRNPNISRTHNLPIRLCIPRTSNSGSVPIVRPLPRLAPQYRINIPTKREIIVNPLRPQIRLKSFASMSGVSPTVDDDSNKIEIEVEPMMQNRTFHCPDEPNKVLIEVEPLKKKSRPCPSIGRSFKTNPCVNDGEKEITDIEEQIHAEPISVESVTSESVVMCQITDIFTVGNESVKLKPEEGLLNSHKNKVQPKSDWQDAFLEATSTSSIIDSNVFVEHPRGPKRTERRIQ